VTTDDPELCRTERKLVPNKLAYTPQMGPDQDGGIRFLAEEVLPLLKSGS